MEQIRVSKITVDAKLPTRKHPTDAGMDLYSNNVDFYVCPLDHAVVNTGIKLEIPKGHVALIKPKSKNNHLVGAGVVDQDYQGEILVKVFNTSQTPLLINKGDAVAQLLIVPINTPEIVEVPLDDLYKEKTARGSTGGIVEQIAPYNESFPLSYLDPRMTEGDSTANWWKEKKVGE